MHQLINSTSQAPHLAISVEVKSVYGATKVYPVCERARAFARIAGTTTLTNATLREVQALGYEIVSVANADWRRAA